MVPITQSILPLLCMQLTYERIALLLIILFLAWLTAQYMKNAKKEKDKPEPVVPHTTETRNSLSIIPIPVLLTRKEMARGCKKFFAIRGHSIPIDFPPGIAPGSKIHHKLSFGIIELQINAPTDRDYHELEYFIADVAPTADAEAPTGEHSWYMRGIRYMYGIEREINYEQAASRFVKGYEKGDLNAAYMLCHCYKEGKGVPIKPSFVIRLAHYLVQHHYYPAYYYLASAYREGRGVPMDPPLAAEYSAKLVDLCTQPLEGVEESIRYDALLYHEMQRDTPDPRELERLARQNFAVSQLPTRYSLLAVSLLRDVRSSATAREELRTLLDAGIQAKDMGCYYLKGLLLCNSQNPVFTPDDAKGLSYLHQAADSLRTPASLKSYLINLKDTAAAQEVLKRFWESCTLGVSGLKGSDTLPCSVRIAFPASSPKNYHAMDFFAQEEANTSIKADSPSLIIKNESTETINDVHIRICCIEKKLDTTIMTSPIAPGEVRSINPAESYQEIGKRLYIEVFSGGRYARLYLPNAHAVKDIESTPYLPKHQSF